MGRKLRDKLLLGYALGIVLLCVVAGLGLFASEHVSRSFRIVAEQSVPQMRALSDLRHAGLRLVSSVTEYVLIETEKRRLQTPANARFGEEIEEGLVEEAALLFDHALAEFMAHSMHKRRDEQVAARIREHADALIDAGNRVMQAVHDPIGGPVVLSAREVFEHREQEYLVLIEELLDASSMELEQGVEVVHTATTVEVYLLLSAGIFSVLLALGAATFVTRRVTRPLTHLTDAAAEISDGDLGVRVTPISDDEIGELAAAFNRMAVELKRTTVSRDFLDKVISTMSEALLVVDPEFRVTMCNDAAVKLFGYPEDELRRISAACLLHAPPRRPENPTGATGLLESISQVCECVAYDREGRQLPVLLSGAMMFDRNDVVTGAVLIVRDITETKNAQRQLVEAKERAEYATRSKSAFLANMSHEIRTPLNGLLGNAELLGSTQLDRRQQQFLSTILRSGESLLQVINDILDFSKIEAGKLTIKTEDCDLRQLIGEVARALADSAFSKGLEFICELPPAQRLLVRGDAMRIRQVLTNLVGNAIKFTESGEVLIEVSRASDSSQLTVKVRDSGVGVPRDVQHLIFESFTQVGAQKAGGTGLGLAVSRQLVELMGGEIGVVSDAGQGACFWFTCPTPTVTAAAPECLAPELRGRNFLLVEPNTNARRVLIELCHYWQCRYQAFASLDEALVQLAGASTAKFDFGLVPVDQLLAGNAGQQLLERRLVQRVLAMGSAYQEGSDEALTQLGVRRFLRKPILRDELYASLISRDRSESAQRSGSLLRPRPASANSLAKDQLHAKILVVDDNAVNRYLVQDMLAQAGCLVDMAETGLQGLQKLQDGSYDLALMDCQLPDIDGEEVTRRLRVHEHETGRLRTPVVALTANALSGDRARCIESGMDDFISKPFRQQQLLSTIRHWVEDRLRSSSKQAN